MRRRSFFTMFGFGAVATVAGVSKAGTPEKHDIHWARKMCQEGHRVRLLSWCTPLHERQAPPGNISVMTVTQGTKVGVESVDDLTMTPGMLAGPWEIVPKEDYPKPPDPPGYGYGGEIVITGGHGGSGGSVSLKTY